MEEGLGTSPGTLARRAEEALPLHHVGESREKPVKALEGEPLRGEQLRPPTRVVVLDELKLVLLKSERLEHHFDPSPLEADLIGVRLFADQHARCPERLHVPAS